MVGGYVQLAYGFNYYGTVGCNRDEQVVLAQGRGPIDIGWLERPQLTPERDDEARNPKGIGNPGFKHTGTPGEI